MINLMVLHWGTVEGNTVIAEAVGVPISANIQEIPADAVLPPLAGMGGSRGVRAKGASRGVRASGGSKGVRGSGGSG